ncbi:hypothetical protein KAU08_06325 [bacterium]|nr:hypothetical protein [bacterium]
MEPLKRDLVPYESFTPGTEAVFTGEDPSVIDESVDPSILPGYCQLVKFKDPNDRVIVKAVRERAGIDELTEIAIGQGMITIAADAVRRAANGETSLNEAMRVVARRDL